MLDRIQSFLGLGPKEEPEIPGANRVIWVYLIVQVGLFAGLAWKWEFFSLTDQVYHQIPIVDPFFPAWARSAEVVRWAFLGSIAGIFVGTVGMWVWVRRLAAFVTTMALAIMCVHQGSYNDMTFTTSFWVSLWIFWYTTRMERDEPKVLLDKAAFLSRTLGSAILLGGAVGKWTPEYWSGDVFYDIYFVDRDYWVFNWLRDTYETETLRIIAVWYSRKVIVLETLAGFLLWRLPARWAGAFGAIIFFSIACLSNFWLYSVLTCLIGLSLSGLFVMKEIGGRDGSFKLI